LPALLILYSIYQSRHMFSQFRNAVEHLQQQQQSQPINRRPASNSVSSDQSDAQARTHQPRTSSLDETHRSHMNATPGQLAESALLNFRRTLISSRSSAPSQLLMPDKDSSKHARSLEERLRASFSVGEASERTTPDASKLHTPAEVEPASVALPLSPELEAANSALEEAFDPLGVQLSPNPSQGFRSPPIATEFEQLSLKASTQGLNPIYSQATSSSSSLSPPPPTAAMPSHPSPSRNTPNVANPAGDEAVSDPAATRAPTPNAQLVDISALRADSRPATPPPPLLSPLPVEDKEHEVETLRERLKLVEQRFSGEFCIFVYFVEI
jgi:hypothetical protein